MVYQSLLDRGQSPFRRGLGDVVAHLLLRSGITDLLVKSGWIEAGCQECKQRQEALNTLPGRVAAKLNHWLQVVVNWVLWVKE